MNHRLFAAAALACLCPAAPAAAQGVDSVSHAPSQAASILPLHAAFGFYGGDYERIVGQTVTAGVGAAYFSLGDDGDEFQYGSVEAKVRYYPSGDPLDGLSFGLTVGPTFLSGESGAADVDEDLTALGIGFEIAAAT